MPPRIAHKQSNELYNVPLGVLSHRGTQANGKQTVHCINHMDYWKVKIYFNIIDHNVNSRRPCYSQVYVQPQLLIESHIRCEFTANQIVLHGFVMENYCGSSNLTDSNYTSVS